MMNFVSKYLLPLAAAGMLTFGVFHMVHSEQKYAVPKGAPPVAPVRTPFARSVAASGIVEPSTENIAIGAALSGVVLEVHIPGGKVGRRVSAGDPLFRVDDRQLRAQLAFQEANLFAAREQLAKLEAMPRQEELPPSEAKVRMHETNVALLQDQFERGKKLFATNAIGAEEQVSRELKFRSAEQQLAQAKAENQLLLAGAWGPDKAIAKAAVEQAQAQIEQIKTEIERSTVRAPVDGNVLQVNVRPGEYVGSAAGKSLLVLGDLERLHVRVDIDEHDIPRFRTTAAARAYVRGNGNHPLELTFVRVEPYVIPKKALTGDNTERVDTRVLPVIYAVQSSEQPIYVGQQLDVHIEAPPATSPPT